MRDIAADASFCVGVDVGGTFTDLIAFDRLIDSFRISKVPTTAGDQSTGLMEGIVALGVTPKSIEELIHGTTVGTNAILERRGARCGLITTRGFRDLLELGRRTRPHLYGMIGQFVPLIPRDLRMEVTERIDAQGNIVEPLDEAEVRAAIGHLLDLDVEALVIHFLHSYCNPVHENRCAEIARELWPNAYVSLGSRILREVREFERGTAAAINAYIQPVISNYVGQLVTKLKAAGFSNELLITQGNGGTMVADIASEQAIQTVMSGPAAGVNGAAKLATAVGCRNVISCDMGGTSFDVALILDGMPAISVEKDIDYAIPVRVPMIDIHTIGAGGGSIARVNRAGILQVGPESAGARPGPVCFRHGGEEPTVTDAHLLLGRINQHGLTGVEGEGYLDEVLRAIAGKIGEPLGLDPYQAAMAIISVANHQMAGAIRLVSVEKGYDPRDFTLLAFGGAGPLHAVDLARELGIPAVLVPRYPGLVSALGCTLADIRHDFVQHVNKPAAQMSGQVADAIFAAQVAEGRALLERERARVLDIDIVHEVDMLYSGQLHEFRVRVEAPGFRPDEAVDAFARLYRDRFDIELPEISPVFVNLRTTLFGRRSIPDLRLLAGGGAETACAPAGERRVFFGSAWHRTCIFRRDELAIGQTVEGPAIIEQLDSTTVINPGASARVDEFGSLIVAVGT